MRLFASGAERSDSSLELEIHADGCWGTAGRSPGLLQRPFVIGLTSPPSASSQCTQVSHNPRAIFSLTPRASCDSSGYFVPSDPLEDYFT